MNNNREIKQKISSIESTQKITQVMKLIAVIHLKRARTLLESNQKTMDAVLRTLDSLPPAHSLMQQHGNDAAASAENPLIIAIGGNKGLCGSYNGSVVSCALASLPNAQSKIICIGDRIRAALMRTHADQICQDVNWKLENDPIRQVHEIVRYCTEHYLSKEFTSIDVCYLSTPVKALTGTMQRHRLLPIPLPEAQKKKDCLFEPTTDAVVDRFLFRYLEAMVYHILLQASVSEQNARMIAMDSATRNTESILEELQIRYNRNRQAEITNTLIDIINSSEAQT